MLGRPRAVPRNSFRLGDRKFRTTGRAALCDVHRVGALRVTPVLAGIPLVVVVRHAPPPAGGDGMLADMTGSDPKSDLCRYLQIARGALVWKL